MKLLKNILLAGFGLTFITSQAQSAKFFTAPVPGAKGANYLFNNPDTSFNKIIAFNSKISSESIQPAIETYGIRQALFETDSFTIEIDRTLALYFKAKKEGKSISQKFVLPGNECWENGGILYFESDGKNILKMFIASEQGTTVQKKGGGTATCGTEVFQVNIEEQYASATGTHPKSLLEKVADGISVSEGRKVIVINVPRDAYITLVSLNFKLYDTKGKEVKDFLNMQSAENILYINDLPKGRYKYIIETYQGTLVKRGEIQITKAQK